MLLDCDLNFCDVANCGAKLLVLSAKNLVALHSLMKYF